MQILEKRFEDWICDNIGKVAGGYSRLVGRQITLPNGGILDVLAVSEEPDSNGEMRPVFSIIEVKKEVIDAAAVQQVLTYMGAFRLALRAGWLMWRQETKQWGAEDPEIRGVLAAPSISNEAAWMIGGCEVLNYVNLEVSISATPWWTMKPGGVDEARVDALARSLVPVIQETVDSRETIRLAMIAEMDAHPTPAP